MEQPRDEEIRRMLLEDLETTNKQIEAIKNQAKTRPVGDEATLLLPSGEYAITPLIANRVQILKELRKYPEFNYSFYTPQDL